MHEIVTISNYGQEIVKFSCTNQMALSKETNKKWHLGLLYWIVTVIWYLYIFSSVHYQSILNLLLCIFMFGQRGFPDFQNLCTYVSIIYCRMTQYKVKTDSKNVCSRGNIRDSTLEFKGVHVT